MIRHRFHILFIVKHIKVWIKWQVAWQDFGIRIIICIYKIMSSFFFFLTDSTETRPWMSPVNCSNLTTQNTSTTTTPWPTRPARSPQCSGRSRAWPEKRFSCDAPVQAVMTTWAYSDFLGFFLLWYYGDKNGQHYLLYMFLEHHHSLLPCHDWRCLFFIFSMYVIN